MDGRCETCKWWDTDTDRSLFVAPWCSYLNDEEHGTCLLTISNSGENEETSDAVAFNSCLCTTVLITRPDFGCVQWEAKDK